MKDYYVFILLSLTFDMFVCPAHMVKVSLIMLW